MMNLDEIEDFVQKSTILQKTIEGIADGSIDADEIDLKKYGILTIEQQKDEEKREAKKRKELEQRQARKKKEQAEGEKRQWWEGAECLYGPRKDKSAEGKSCAEAAEATLVRK